MWDEIFFMVVFRHFLSSPFSMVPLFLSENHFSRVMDS